MKYGAGSALNVNFTLQASRDLADIRDWIAETDPRAADRVAARLQQTALLFGSFPMLGRPGRIADTREFSVTGLPYLIVYRFASATEIDVLTIVHTRRRFPA